MKSSDIWFCNSKNGNIWFDKDINDGLEWRKRTEHRGSYVMSVVGPFISFYWFMSVFPFQKGECTDLIFLWIFNNLFIH